MSSGNPRNDKQAAHGAQLEDARRELRACAEALAATREQRDLYQDLIERSKDLVYAMNADGIITFCGPQTARYGYATEEVVGRSMIEFVHPDDVAQATAEFTETMTSGRDVVSYLRIVCKDGSAVPVEEVGQVIRKDDRITGIVGIVRDITERRRAEEALRESEEKYRQLFATETDAVMVFDASTRRFVDVNDAATRLYGYAREELLSMKQSDITAEPEESDASIRRTISGALDRIPVRYHKKKDGTRFPVEIAGSTFQLGGRQVLCGVVRDITERVRAEEQLRELNRNLEQRVAERTAEFEFANKVLRREVSERVRIEAALRESEERYRTLAESAEESIFIIGADLRVQYANSHATVQTGRAPDALVGVHVSELFSPDQKERIDRNLRHVLTTGEPLLAEDKITFATSPPRHVWLETRLTPLRAESGEVRSVLGISRDVTARRTAQEALRESEQRYRNVYETAPLAFVLWDRDTLVVDWNRHAEQVFGWSRDEVIGRSFFDFILPEEARVDVEDVVAALLNGRLTNRSVNANLTKSGAAITCEWNNSILRDGEGNIIGAMSLGLDITDRVRAQEALAESEEQYRAMYQAVPDSLLAFDSVTFEVLAVNDAMASIFHYTPDDLVGKPAPLDTLIHPDDHDLLHWQQQKLGVRDLMHYPNIRCCTKEGAVLRTDLTAAHVQLGGRKCRLLIIHDISERVRAQEALAESEEQYRTIYQAIPDSLFVFDSVTFELLAVNDAMTSLFHYTPDDLVGKPAPLDTLIHPDDHDRIHGQQQKLGVRDLMHYPNIRCCTKEGGVLRTDLTAASVRLGGRKCRLVIIRDVTESVEARRRIERQAMLLSNVTDAVAVATTDRVVTYWNRGAEQMFGFTEAEMVGRQGSLDRVLRPEHDPEQVAEEILSAIRSEGHWENTRFPCRHKNGTDLWINVSSSTLSLEQGEPGSIMVVARDVTEEVLLQQRLIRGERLAAIGNLASGVAHELNNLLGGLRGLAELTGDDRNHVPLLIDTCRAVAERGGAIAERLSTLAKADEPRQDRLISIPAVVHTALTMVEPMLNQRTIKAVDNCEPVPETWGNEGKILQVLLNLLVNASDSIGRLGTIVVGVRHETRPEDAIVITVSDTGAGIRPDDLPRLFDPFFSTKRETGSESGERTHLGLGLAESADLIRGYGGAIDVESQVGKGAAFTVRLPVRSGPASRRAKAPRKPRLPRKGTRLLVVDDDALMRYWLTAHLEERGYHVVGVDNGAEAARLCAEKPFPFVFLDLLMPGEMDGAATFRKLKQVCRKAKVIIITAYARDTIPDDCLRGAHAVLKKPFGMDDVARAFAGESTPT